MLRTIYLSPFGYVISLLMRCFAALKRPFIVYGYYCRGDRKFRKNTRISSSASIISPERLSIGDHCWVGHNAIIDASGGVTIGEGVQIGFHSCIFTHGSHISIRLLGKDYINVPAEKRPGLVRESSSVGEYTFLGSGAVVMPGTTIGKGCVIAVGSVVHGVVPDFSVMAGNPARRFGDTRDQDKAFLEHPEIAQTYFDKDHWESLQRA